MDKRVLDFLKNNRVSVLGISQNDLKIHSATLHFALSETPLEFIFLTKKDSRKCASLLDGSLRNASLVVGFNEEEFSTFQAGGRVEIVSDSLELNWSTYTAKYPDRAKRKDDNEYVLLKFTPDWWNFSDLKTTPPTIINSSS